MLFFEQREKTQKEIDAEKNFGEIVKMLREKHSYSQETLATKTNLTIETIQNIENYGQNIELDTIVLFAKAFGISLVELFTYFEECYDAENKIR